MVTSQTVNFPPSLLCAGRSHLPPLSNLERVIDYHHCDDYYCIGDPPDGIVLALRVQRHHQHTYKLPIPCLNVDGVIDHYYCTGHRPT